MAGTANELIWSSAQGPQDQFLELLKSGQLSDMRVHCGERVWRAHKVILCTRSEWFRLNWDESRSESLELHEIFLDNTGFEAHEIDCLLHYIYSGSVNVTTSYPAIGSFASISVWLLGDHFGIPGLCKLALDGFKEQLRKASWEFAGASSSSDWDESIKTWVGFVRQLYAYRGWRKAVFEALGPTTLSFLVSSIHIFGGSGEFKDLLRDTPEFASDWAAALTDIVSSVTMPPHMSAHCSRCGMLVLGHLNRSKWLKYHQVEYFCQTCFPLQ